MIRERHCVPHESYRTPPAVSSDAERTARIASLSSPQNPKANILLVEDADWIRETLAGQLRNEGYTVFEAVDGEDAIAIIAENRGPFLALISDLDMPRKSGQELILEIEAGRYLFSAYVLVSGHGSEEPRIQSLLHSKMRAPFYFCPKPFDVETISHFLSDLRNQLVSNEGGSRE